ncbi:hypothetical protein C0995_000759, partial [Termitomyces sp. Mi166
MSSSPNFETSINVQVINNDIGPTLQLIGNGVQSSQEQGNDCSARSSLDITASDAIRITQILQDVSLSTHDTTHQLRPETERAVVRAGPGRLEGGALVPRVIDGLVSAGALGFVRGLGRFGTGLESFGVVREGWRVRVGREFSGLVEGLVLVFCGGFAFESGHRWFDGRRQP